MNPSSATPPRSPLPVTRRELERGNVLVFAPHPDDEVLGCGLTCHRHHLQGDRVDVVIGFDGALGNRGSEALAPEVFVAQRQAESRAACDLLGFEPPLFLGAPEGHVPAAHEFASAVDRVVALVAERRPVSIFAPWIGEHQLDHHVLARVVFEAHARLARPRSKLWQYEIWSALVPTHVVDVSDLWPLKERALALHRTQFEHTDLLHHIGGLNAHRALYAGNGARRAEAFALIE